MLETPVENHVTAPRAGVEVFLAVRAKRWPESLPSVEEENLGPQISVPFRRGRSCQPPHRAGWWQASLQGAPPLGLVVLEGGQLVDDHDWEGPATEIVLRCVYQPDHVLPIDDIDVSSRVQSLKALPLIAHNLGHPQMLQVLPLGGLFAPGVLRHALGRDDQDRPVFHVVVQQPVDRGQGGDGLAGSHAPEQPGRRVVQDPKTITFTAEIVDPGKKFDWTDADFEGSNSLYIYEAHVGMAQEEGRVGTYKEFADITLNHIKEAGSNPIQLRAIMDHPYYGSFGYQVSNFFAPSSRYGSNRELKELINTLISERGNNADLNDIYVSNIKDMSYLFSGSNFNGDISKWNVSNVQNMSYMFSHAKFNGDISNWNVNKVKNMIFMFKDNPLKNNPPAWYRE